MSWSKFQLEVVRGVQAYAARHPAWRLFVDGAPHAASPIHAGNWEWDGVITSDLTKSAFWHKLARSPRTRIVSITAAPPRGLSHLPTVRCDESKMATAAVQHFLAGGFRHMAYYGPLGWGREDSRGKAFVAAADDALHEADCVVFAPGSLKEWDRPTSLARQTRWVAKLPKPVGIFTWNMSTARVMAEACKRAGTATPADVAIVAADDDPIPAENMEPTLTGMVLPAERMGYEAAALLDRLMAGAAAPEAPVLVNPPGVIHVRESSDVSTILDRNVLLAVQYIRERAAGPISVSQVARAVSVSRGKLGADFRRYRGHTVHEEIVGAHLERARQLLRDTDWSVQRVGEASGFGTKQHFYRVFLAREQTTPAAYREKFRRG
jgi:LacI family transcriptional regulator